MLSEVLSRLRGALVQDVPPEYDHCMDCDRFACRPSDVRECPIRRERVAAIEGSRLAS